MKRSRSLLSVGGGRAAGRGGKGQNVAFRVLSVNIKSDGYRENRDYQRGGVLGQRPQKGLEMCVCSTSYQ